MSFEDVLIDATNAYRTKYFIVTQVIDVNDNGVESAELCSRDTYFSRTQKRDADYERVFRERKQMDGKRLPTTMFSRQYID